MEKSSECIPSIAGAGDLTMEVLHKGKKKGSVILWQLLREMVECRFNDSLVTSHDRGRCLVTL